MENLITRFRIKRLIAKLPTVDWPRSQKNYKVIAKLAKIGQPAVPALIHALEDTRPKVRFLSAKTLGLIQDPRALPALINSLQDKTANVRKYSAYALGEIKDPSALPLSVPALIRATEDQVDVRNFSKLALLNIGAPALRFLRAACTETPINRYQYLEIMGTIRQRHGYGNSQTNLPLAADIDSLDLSRISDAKRLMKPKPIVSAPAIAVKKQIISK